MNLIPIECPQGWVSEKLGSLCGVFTTGKLDANAMVSDGDFPFFTCAREALRIDRYAFDDEALLVSGNGANVGYVHYYNGKFNAYQRTYVISKFSADVQYLKLFLENNLEERIRKEVNAGNTPYITMSTLTDMEVVLPSSQNEQRAIATALSDIDALIAGLERLIGKKRDIKQAAMQQLLTGQTRLPGFSGEWEVERFNAIFSRVNVKSHQIGTNAYLPSGQLPVVDQGKLAVIAYSDDIEARFKCPKDGVIVFGDHTCIVKFVNFDFLVGADGTQVLIAKNGHCARFYAFDLQYRGIEPTGYNRHFKFLQDREFICPTFEEQQAIAAVLSDMDADLTALESRLTKTRSIKQGMMQELLTGRTRLL